jgi:hypothetical protein
MATPFCAFTAAVDCVRTKAKPKKRMAARSAPSLTAPPPPPPILFLGFMSSYTAIKPLMGLIFNSQKCLHAFVNWYYSRNLYQDKSKPKKEIVALSATISFLGLKGRFASLLF